MKILLCLFATACLLAGCDNHQSATNARLDKIEAQITDISSNLTELYQRNENRLIQENRLLALETNLLGMTETQINTVSNQDKRITQYGWAIVALQDQITALTNKQARVRPQ